ncbi:hypothetical protein TRFO_42329 [Tritrichomonas foetus]|uniref:Sulfatase N-terminal domain-containing protein n=1 Tax=Tritrichomonas foetus TaxID=1144522 RepID=A0A1J4KX41_9EUKA|nr:hypothetical protein TRFO_42329 [Tritrichomonas foetus]|eukprot:OHT15746.1 hypothetical protein TRFO_42329 [Tritrichomonas foetus]
MEFKKKTKVDIAKCSFRLVVLLAVEFIKKKYGQSNSRTFAECAFIAFLTLLSDDSLISNVLFLVTLTINCSETVSWIFQNTALSYQSLEAVNIEYIVHDHPIFIWYFFLVLVFAMISVYLPIFKYKVDLPDFRSIVVCLLLTYTYIFFMYILHDFYGKSGITFFNHKSNDLIYHLKRMANEKAVVLEKSNTKNLILVQLESFGYDIIQSHITPYLKSLSEKYEFIGPIESMPYTTWSTGGTIVTQCGVPEVMSSIAWNVRGHQGLKYVLPLKCLPDYLRSMNYSLLFVNDFNEKIMDFISFRDGKKYRKTQVKNDLEIANNVVEKFLPMIDLQTRINDTRTLLWVANEQTHAPYRIPAWCKPSDKLNAFQKCFNCGDQFIKKIVDKYLDLKMYEHSVLVIYPDHHPYGGAAGTNMKKIFMVFPGMEKSKNRVEEKLISYYDFAPTVMNLVGANKYSPGFPFGRNIFNRSSSCTIANKPDNEDLNTFYFDLIKKNRTNNFIYKCKLDNGKFVDSTTPCSYTAQAKIL